jgi:antitoxin CptB
MTESAETAGLCPRRRRLLFRANHRGTKENDLLIGGFVAKHIATLSDEDMRALEEILELPDPLVTDWLMDRAPLPPDNAMLRRIYEAARVDTA